MVPFVVAMKLLGIACANCKSFNKSLIDLMRLAAFETKTEIAFFHSVVDPACFIAVHTILATSDNSYKLTVF